MPEDGTAGNDLQPTTSSFDKFRLWGAAGAAVLRAKADAKVWKPATPEWRNREASRPHKAPRRFDGSNGCAVA